VDLQQCFCDALEFVWEDSSVIQQLVTLAKKAVDFKCGCTTSNCTSCTCAKAHVGCKVLNCKCDMGECGNPHNDPEGTCDKEDCTRKPPVDLNEPESDPDDDEEEILQMDIEEHESDDEFDYLDLLGDEDAGIGSGDDNANSQFEMGRGENVLDDDFDLEDDDNVEEGFFTGAAED
jgi:hypothetical protein